MTELQAFYTTIANFLVYLKYIVPIESQDTYFGFMNFVMFAVHATVSLRDNPSLPAFLGRGLTQEHWTVHLRVALCNVHYGTLMLWLAFVRIGEPVPPSLFLKLSFLFAASYCIGAISRIRGRRFLQTAPWAKRG